MKSSTSLRLLCQAALALGLVLVAGMPAHGQGVPGYPDDVRYGFDAREVAMLPRYCIYTQLFRDNVPGGNNPEEIKRWYSIMGDTFHAMHHYCWGLMKTNRATLLARTQESRMFYLNDSIGEFDFVIQRAKPDFVMLPEILTKKGENLIRLGRGPQGILELQRAIKLKPDYWPPYAAMSDHYKATGEIRKAREVLEEALSHSPDAKALKTRLAELEKAEGKRKTAP
jgi:tetratricopeptide (TPR) repeat protein